MWSWTWWTRWYWKVLIKADAEFVLGESLGNDILPDKQWNDVLIQEANIRLVEDVLLSLK